MNSNFSIKRIRLIVKRYILEGQNQKVQLVTFGVLIFVFTCQFINFSLDIKQLLYLFAIVLTINQFTFFSTTNADGIHYLSIPASHFEKTIAFIIISNVYFFIAVFFIYLTVNFVGTNLSNLLSGTHNLINLDFLSQKGMLINEYNRITITKINIWDIMGKVIILQTLIILGHLSFKLKSVWKNVFIAIMFGIWLCLAQPIVINFIINKINMAISLILNPNIHINNFKMDDSFQLTKISIYFILISFMWISNYMMLRKKQITN